MTACPGTDTCKLGIASSRGLAGSAQLAAEKRSISTRRSATCIKVSGCFNSCGQHHVADIGFYGNSRNVAGFTVPHFQVMLGGQWSKNAAMQAGSSAIPSKRAGIGQHADRSLREGTQAAKNPSRAGARVGKKELKPSSISSTPR